MLVWIAKQRCTHLDLSDVAAFPLESLPSSASSTNSDASLTCLSHSSRACELELACGATGADDLKPRPRWAISGSRRFAVTMVNFDLPFVTQEGHEREG